ncbi:MAG: hypothetical protein Q8Q22_01210 [bacterium]|nr:hypothetical protein [bacterium]MDZ4206113.1 hypothetical protein [Patescibacteria group bacterium]
MHRVALLGERSGGQDSLAVVDFGCSLIKEFLKRFFPPAGGSRLTALSARLREDVARFGVAKSRSVNHVS